MTEIKPRQRRGQETRAVLLDATIQSLGTHGYAGTTMARIQARAGVSRGSLTHHFPSMQELLVAAIHHVAQGQLGEMTELMRTMKQNERPDDLVSLLYRFMSGPLFVAGLELWLAARTDETLHAALVPVERDLGRRLRAALESAGIAGAGAPITREDLDLLFVLLRGLAVTQILRDDDSKQRQLLKVWTQHVQNNS